MQPLDTYKKNRKNHAPLGRGGDDAVFAYPCTGVGLCPRPAYYRRWWNVRMFYHRMYRELSYDFKHNEMNHIKIK